MTNALPMMSEPRHWPGREGRQNESRDRVMRKPLVVGWTKKVWRVVLKAGRWEGEGNLSNRRAHPDSKVRARATSQIGERTLIAK